MRLLKYQQPEVYMNYQNLVKIASSFPEFDVNAKIQLLIGRDLIEAHHILKQITGHRGQPFAQRLCLGWAIFGEVSLGRVHQRTTVNVNKVSIINNGSATCSNPCKHPIHVEEQMLPSIYIFGDRDFKFRGDDVFLNTHEDECNGLSTEERLFIKLTDR